MLKWGGSKKITRQNFKIGNKIMESCEKYIYRTALQSQRRRQGRKPCSLQYTGHYHRRKKRITGHVCI